MNCPLLRAFQELTGLGTLGEGREDGGMRVPRPSPHFQVHISKYEVSAAAYSACGTVWHSGVSSCLPLLALPWTLPSVTSPHHYPSHSQEHFPLSEELAVYRTSGTLSYIGFIKLFPVYILAFLILKSVRIVWVVCDIPVHNKPKLGRFRSV